MRKVSFDWAWSWTRYAIGVEWYTAYDKDNGYVTVYVIGLRVTWWWRGLTVR